jgi:hypothetical protein
LFIGVLLFEVCFSFRRARRRDCNGLASANRAPRAANTSLIAAA